MKLKHLDFFHKTLRKYRRLQARLAEMNSPHLFRKLDMLRRRLLRLNRAWKLGLSMAALLAGMTGTTQAQTFPATITIDTLSQNMGMVLIGENEYDSFGQSVHGAGDFNGDGIDDIIVGAPEFETEIRKLSQGRTYVIFGSATPPDTLFIADLDGSNSMTITGKDRNHELGFSVSKGGDVNGDGIDDIIIGAPGAEVDFRDGPEKGETYVIFGTPTPPASLNLARLDGTNGFLIRGAEGRERSGNAVSGAFDANGDGFDDILIGASDAGKGYLVFGGDSLPAVLALDSLVDNQGYAIDGVRNSGQFGTSVSGLGDVNNDGFEDMIIGAPDMTTSAGSRSGESYIITGGDTFPTTGANNRISLSRALYFRGADDYDKSGISVSRAGDVNGDGIDDLVIGAHFAGGATGSKIGETYVVFGSDSLPNSFNLGNLDGDNGFMLNGIERTDYAGAVVSYAGDINGDNFSDIIISAYNRDVDGKNRAGEVYVIFGASSFPVSYDLENLDGRFGFTLNTKNPDYYLGRSASGCGDFNNDGIDDLILGAPEADQSSNGNRDNGHAYVIYGHRNTTFITPEATTLPLEVFPNPASAALRVHVPLLDQAAEVSLKIYDLLGRELLPADYTRTGSDRLQLDIGVLPQGSYVLRVQLDGEVGTARFVKE